MLDFLFYLPNLIVVQIYLHGRLTAASTRTRRLAAATLIAATAFLLLGTYFFTTKIWAPEIMTALTS